MSGTDHSNQMYHTLHEALQKAPLGKEELIRIAQDLNIDVDTNLDIFTLREELVHDLLKRNQEIIKILRLRFPRMPDVQLSILLVSILGLLTTSVSFYRLYQKGVRQTNILTFIFFMWKIWITLLISIAPVSVVIRTLKLGLREKQQEKILKLLNMYRMATLKELQEINQCSKMSFWRQVVYCKFSFKQWFHGGLRGGWVLNPSIEKDVLLSPYEEGLREILRRRFINLKENEQTLNRRTSSRLSAKRKRLEDEKKSRSKSRDNIESRSRDRSKSRSRSKSRDNIESKSRDRSKSGSRSRNRSRSNNK